MTKARTLTLVAILLLGGAAPARAQQPPPAPGVEELHRLDALPRFRRSVAVGSVSSYDRTGGNDDGFSGKHSFLRKEPGGLVVADLQGPGIVYRIWTPTPTDDLVELYFDGETTPRISVPFRDLFTGARFPFLTPVSGVGAGGFYTYVPIPYERSLKVLVRAENLQFYQINYATYPADAGIRSYSAAASTAFKAHLERARALFASAGTNVSAAAAPPGARVETLASDLALAPGGAVTVFETDSPGRIVGMRIGPASAFAGKERDVRIRAYWDGDAEPAIDCPVADFFGYSWGEPAVTSLLLGTSRDTNYVYLPMPFDRSARVELVSERAAGPEIRLRAEVDVVRAGRADDEGRLYAVRRRENPTTEGRPYTFVEAEGRGHVVGAILQAQGAEPGAVPEFFEGDDETTIDGEVAVRGTGSEDFFNGGWYDVPGRWEDRVSLPLSGSLDFKRHMGRTGGYRFMLGDAYAYRKSIRSTIEHGPVGNRFPADYTSVTFLYADRRPAGPLGPRTPEERRVADPDRVVFTPGWTTPIHAFSWSNASLAKEWVKIGSDELRYLSLKAEGREVFGPHYLSFILEMPAAGRYRVSIQGVEGPAQGRVQIFRNEVALGEAADLYAPERRKGAMVPLAVLDMEEGDNRVLFKVVGKNERSSGTNLDVFRIVCERVE